MPKQKIIGLLVILLGIPFGVTALDNKFPWSVFASAGLIMIFFSPERINDERVQLLKMKAIYTAMSAGLGLTFIVYSILFSAFPDLRTQPLALHNTISAYEFLAGILLLSLGLFHYWRWQDGS